MERGRGARKSGTRTALRRQQGRKSPEAVEFLACPAFLTPPTSVLAIPSSEKIDSSVPRFRLCHPPLARGPSQRPEGIHGAQRLKGRHALLVVAGERPATVPLVMVGGGLVAIDR